MIIKRVMFVLIVLLAISAGGVGQCVSGESVPVKSRTRRVLGPGGKGVPRAKVTVSDASGKVLFETRSDAQGKFSVPRLNHDDRWLNDKDFHVEVAAPGFIRYRYILLRSGDSRKVQPLPLTPTSAALCNDVKLESVP
jgi:hypothetical protein